MEATIELTESKGGLSLDELMAVADKAHPRQDLLDSPPSGWSYKVRKFLVCYRSRRVRATFFGA
jgi:hypothetical protein